MCQLHLELLEDRIVLNTYHLHQGDNLQAALNSAAPGDTLYLDAGAVFTGPITLRPKTNPDHLWITIATDNFPVAPDMRVSPSDAPSMAAIVAPGCYKAAVQTAPGAAFYRLQGLNILPVDAHALVDTLVLIGSANQSTTNNLPNNIVIDQCYIHGLDGQSIKRGVALNDGGPDSTTGVYNSYLADFKIVGYDSQAIAGWNGTGPYTIENNYLEAAGENVLFGGALSYIQRVPSNIVIVDNLFSKPLSWDPYDASYAGIPWSVKNLLELKNADTVTIENNVFEHNWVQSQDGHAILFTPRGDQSGGPWVTVSNVTFSQNILNHLAQGINLLGSDDSSRSQRASNLTIRDNLVGADIGSAQWGGTNGQFLEIEDGNNGGPQHVVVDHNTITGGHTIVLVSGTVSDFTFTNNIVLQAGYGIIVSGYGEGGAALEEAFPAGYTITNNVIIGGDASAWPSGNWCPADLASVGFDNYLKGSFILRADSPYHGLATDGTDPGSDLRETGGKSP